MSFSVYFEQILNTHNGHFHIEIMISAHTCSGACFPENFFYNYVICIKYLNISQKIRVLIIQREETTTITIRIPS